MDDRPQLDRSLMWRWVSKSVRRLFRGMGAFPWIGLAFAVVAMPPTALATSGRHDRRRHVVATDQTVTAGRLSSQSAPEAKGST
jgi:hypothetical protein